jgi:hypothetical protein
MTVARAELVAVICLDESNGARLGEPSTYLGISTVLKMETADTADTADTAK